MGSRGGTRSSAGTGGPGSAGNGTVVHSSASSAPVWGVGAGRGGGGRGPGGGGVPAARGGVGVLPLGVGARQGHGRRGEPGHDAAPRCPARVWSVRAVAAESVALSPWFGSGGGAS